MVTALSAQSDLQAMLPSIAVLVAFIGVAGCCLYVSYRVGQGISPASRMLQERVAELSAAVARSESDFRQSLERHREATGKEARRLLEDGARASDQQVQFVRRGLEDFGERVNGLRVDFERDTARLREAVEAALAGAGARAREDARELARTHGEALGGLTARIGEFGRDGEHRQERAAATLEVMGADLKAVYAAGAGELGTRMGADLAEFRAAVDRQAQAMAEQRKQLDAMEQGVRTALHESAGKHDALNAAVEGKQDSLRFTIQSKQDALNAAIATQFARFRDEASAQLAQLLAADDRLEASWGQLQGDFDAITRSLVQISRAMDSLRSELIVKVGEGEGTAAGVEGLLERVLQPNEFERDVEIEPGTSQRVAFAVRLSDNPVTRVWLPIEALPVVRGYNEFVAASVYDDADAMKSSSEAFERAILRAARDLSVKFVCPPRTLNLAVLLAPTDDLFAEIARRDGLVDNVRRNFHVMIAGPATLPTLLMGLRMAFRGTSMPAPGLANGPQRASAADGD